MASGDRGAGWGCVVKIALTVEIDLRFREGKFESKDEMAELLREEIEGMDLGEIEGGNGGIYDIESWEVSS